MDQSEHTSGWLSRFSQFLRELLGFPFMFKQERKLFKVLTFLWILMLFLVGGVLWWYFLNRGDIRFDLHDWVETSGRLAFIQDAIRTNQLPLHISDPIALRGTTDRFMAIGDTIISPQVLLLAFLEVDQFILVDVLLLFTTGFLGLLLVRRHLRLSLLPFTLLYFLLFFNGHLTAHIAVGHMHWAGYMLIPFFIYGVLKIVEGASGWGWILFMAGTLFVFLLQGLFHLYLMCLIFLFFLMFVYPQQVRTILISIIASVILAAIRIIPPALDLSAFDQQFLSGFVTALELVEGQVVLKFPVPSDVYTNNPFIPLGWWERDFYIGLLGFLLIMAGLFTIISKREEYRKYLGLLLPIGVLVLMSIDRIYKIFHHLQIPLLNSQRVSTRMYFLPLVFLVIIAVIVFQKEFGGKRYGSWLHLGFLGGSIFLLHDLWQHLKLWRIEHMDMILDPEPYQITQFFVANRLDPIYTSAIMIGLVITSLTLVALIVLALREQRGLKTEGS